MHLLVLQLCRFCLFVNYVDQNNVFFSFRRLGKAVAKTNYQRQQAQENCKFV
jgi:hypothetical protein